MEHSFLYKFIANT